MKLLLLVLLSLAYLCAADRRIVSRPIQSSYNQYGKADRLIIQWKTYEAIYNYDYLKITLPEIIHDVSLKISFNLRSAHSLNILSSQTSLPYVGSNAYFLPIMVNLTANVWYQLQLMLGRSLTIVYGLVELEVVSQSVNPMISYCWNNGFEYYHLEQSSVPSLSILSLNINNSLSLSTLAADRYQVLLEVSSSVDINEPVNITFDFVDFNLSAANLTVNTAVSGAAKGFTFIGSCFARCDYADFYHACIQSTRCELNSTSITITLPYMKLNELYLIETFVVNPPYVSSVWLEAYWKDNSGKTIGLTFANTPLTVNPITVQPQQIRLLWDIPYSTVVSEMGLGLFVNDPALKHQSLSTFDIGFSLNDVTPIQGHYEVRITVGAASVNELSINHNLPSLKTTSRITCHYVMPQIICVGVDAFVNKNYRYYVRARGNFLTTSNLAAFGNVDIFAVGQPGNLFTNLVRGLTVQKVVNSDYHDYGGLHEGVSNFRIGQSMVVSHNDTMLPNSTIKSIQDFLYSADSLVGVDASITPQQLLFFLKVPLASMSQPSASTHPQNYTMKVFTNPNIMNTSALGLDFVAYSATNNTWDVSYSSCYVDSSTTPTMQNYMCQKYNDHVYGRQIDNTFVKTSKYGLYQWVCGNGQAVVCNTSDCSAACQIFKGGFRSTAITTGTAGVLSLRNVTFASSYQSPIEAGPNNFDFVLTFYHAGVLVSASLINAYTVNKTRLANVRADLINYYNDNVVTNGGNRLPTMVKISGHLTLTELGRKPITAMRVHLPSVLSINNFIETNNFNKLGCSTQSCTASTGAIATALDTWVNQAIIQVRNLPSLTQSWTILVPVVYQAPSQLLQITVSFVQSDGMVGGVYRINGSAVFQTLVGNLNYIALPWTPVNPWLTTLPEWVNQPTNYTFKQSIDLGSIYPFSAMSTINMNATVMPALDASPSTTFTSSYLSIFSNYTYPTVDLQANRCVNPFPYTFMNGYTVWVLWCAVQAGSLNQIIINYPIYQPDFFGSGFPYQMVFAYSYANTKGNMIGYRVDQNAGGTPQTCNTQKSTTYDMNSVNPQQNQYITTFTPFNFRTAPRNKALLTLSMPAQVPMTALSCRAQQPNQNIDFGCAIFSQSSNTFKLEITYSGLSTLPVYSIRLTLRTVKSATATISTIQLFNLTVSLPFTDTGSSLPSFMGTGYAPYASLIASCSNSFTYSSVSSQEYIYLSEPVLTGISAGYYGTLAFKVVFSNSRTVLFDSSTLVITFSQPILNQYSRCQLQPNSHFFMTASIDVTNKIMTLTPKRNIPDFTLISYMVKCSKIVPTGNNITVSMQWKDGVYILQNTFANVIAIHPPINTPYSTFATTLVSKSYSSPGYLAEYTLNLAVSTAGEKMGVWVDFGNEHLHQQFAQAQVSWTTLASWRQVITVVKIDEDVQSGLYIEFFAGTATSFQVRVYGILQTKKTPPTIRLLVKKESLLTGVSTYLASSILDIAPIDITTAPIQIQSFSISPQSYVTIVYALPISYSGVYYVRMDELFRTSSSDVYTCSINGTAVGCWRVRPDLILINNTLPHIATQPTSVQIGVLNYWSTQAYDDEEVRFSIFITSDTGSFVLHGSHEHLQNILLTSSLSRPQSLIWQIAPNQYNSVAQVVNIGYYSQPAQLITSFNLPFVQSFSYNTTMPSPTLFTILDLKAELGTTAEVAYIGTYNSSLVGFRNFIFTHTSPYHRIYSLSVFVSASKCQLKAEFPEYNIVSGGVTIPIAINVSQCRPMQPMTVSSVVNSAYISADTSLSTKTIDMASDVLYVVLSHQLISGTVGQSFQLQVFLTSANTIVNNAYLPIPNITIKVVDSSLLIGNPEAKQPIVNSISQSSINLRIQCNTPATIYWGAGIYPTMLGINVEEIEARLIERNNGLQNNNLDIFSWSHEQYGLNYVNDFNIEKNLTVRGLQGGINYVFKYYCIDQTGKASGGKITQFTTLPSNYSLMKITLSFSTVLNFSQVNSIACAISQTLIIPYNETISSVHSNCINNTEIYYYSWSAYYDEKSSLLIGTGQPYLYFFYIETNRVTSRLITSNLASGLGSNPVFQNSIVPYFGSIRADSLLNAYEPVIKSIGIQISRTQFTITAAIGLQNTYLIAAIMDGHFNPDTQSLPTHYLMKQGFFSAGTKFDQIFSIYGRESLSITFKGLSEGQSISVFYFTTVDNSAINARNSEVMYRDIITNVRPIIDLWSSHHLAALWALALIILLVLH